MPNWCDNSVTLKHEDKSKIDALAAVLEDKENQQVFNHLRPNPAGEWDYNWSVENWGTKWDAGIIDWERQDDNTIWISFDSAWSPPTTLYEYLVEEGWNVEAYYHESGMCFCGMFTNEDGDIYYQYDLTDPDFTDTLPTELIEFANLEEAHRDWMLNNLEEEWSDAERTDWFSVKVKPARDGWYEITTKGWDWPQFCQFKNGSWDSYNEVVKWRGLSEDPSWDPIKALDEIQFKNDVE
jgi:hypothetical protein